MCKRNITFKLYVVEWYFWPVRGRRGEGLIGRYSICWSLISPGRASATYIPVHTHIHLAIFLDRHPLPSFDYVILFVCLFVFALFFLVLSVADRDLAEEINEAWPGIRQPQRFPLALTSRLEQLCWGHVLVQQAASLSFSCPTSLKICQQSIKAMLRALTQDWERSRSWA